MSEETKSTEVDETMVVSETKEGKPSTSRITISDAASHAQIPCPNCGSTIDIRLGKPGAHNYETVSVLIIEHCGETVCGTCNFKVMPQINGIKGLQITLAVLVQEGNVILSPSMEKATREIRAAMERQRGLHDIGEAVRGKGPMPLPNALLRG